MRPPTLVHEYLLCPVPLMYPWHLCFHLRKLRHGKYSSPIIKVSWVKTETRHSVSGVSWCKHKLLLSRLNNNKKNMKMYKWTIWISLRQSSWLKADDILGKNGLTAWPLWPRAPVPHQDFTNVAKSKYTHNYPPSLPASSFPTKPFSDVQTATLHSVNT